MTDPSNRLLLFTAKLGTKREVLKMPRASWACSLFTSPIDATNWKTRGRSSHPVHFETPDVAAYTVMEALRARMSADSRPR